MTATYTWDVFSTLDGYGSHGPEGDWGGDLSNQGPDPLEAPHLRRSFSATRLPTGGSLMPAAAIPRAAEKKAST